MKVTKVAPLGDPLEVSLRGYELSLRRADAAQMLSAAGTLLEGEPAGLFDWLL